MIDDVTMHATLTSYSLTVMFHLKKKLKILRFYCREVESTRNSKLWRLSGRFQTLSWRPGDMVLNLESPGLSGRVDSPVFYSSVASWVLFFSSAASLFPLVIIYGVLQPSSEFLGISHLDKALFGMWHEQNQTAVIRRYKSRQIWKLSNVFFFLFWWARKTDSIDHRPSNKGPN